MQSDTTNYGATFSARVVIRRFSELVTLPSGERESKVTDHAIGVSITHDCLLKNIRFTSSPPPSGRYCTNLLLLLFGQTIVKVHVHRTSGHTTREAFPATGREVRGVCVCAQVKNPPSKLASLMKLFVYWLIYVGVGGGVGVVFNQFYSTVQIG